MNKLIATVAVTLALVAGTAFAEGKTHKDGSHKPAASAKHGHAKGKKAPAKVAPAADSADTVAVPNTNLSVKKQ